MRSASFTPLSLGTLVQSTDALGRSGMAFLPDALPPELEVASRDLRTTLSIADQELARLDGMARQIDRPDLLFASFLRNEAVLSSAIEGTQTSLADLALFEASHSSSNSDDATVANYVRAFEYGRQRVREIRVGKTLFAELHKILLANEDAQRFRPGELRDCQVSIGPGNFEEARFVPPPAIHVADLIENLERYLEEDEEPALIKWR